MRRREIGSSGIEVPVVGLGCNNFGGRIDEAAARAVIDAALDAGVTFFDTADVYGNRGGSEEIIGRALEGGATGSCSRRSSATTSATARPARGARPYIRKAIEASLRRLRTDRIDLYQYHRPDGVTPVEETLGALDELVQEGKVRAVGSSNFTAAMVERRAVRWRRAAPFVSEQSEYSWLARGAEAELLPACERLGIGFIPYFPLASGLLTGKYRRGEPPPEGTRLSGRTPGRGAARAGRAPGGVRRRAWRRDPGCRDRRPARTTGGRFRDRGSDEAGAGAGERGRRGMGAFAGGTDRAAGTLKGRTLRVRAEMPRRGLSARRPSRDDEAGADERPAQVITV